MAKSRDNISNGKEHGQESFDGVGVLLPCEDKKGEYYRTPFKSSDEYTIDDCFKELDDIKNIALELEKPQTATAFNCVVAKAKILGFMDISSKQDSTATIRVINTPAVKNV